MNAPAHNVVPMATLPEEVAAPKERRARRRQPDSIRDSRGHLLLSPHVVAKLTHYSTGTLRTMRCEGKGPPPVKQQGSWWVWYYADELKLWLKENRRIIDWNPSLFVNSRT
ncbi:MAG: hypothetical protein QM741_10875 [Rudaea sp.]|uniref:hypothetical protein n=1 Tax=Rudaea sp. TaxID=2136325 RepID=UPI0039E39E49